MPIGRPSYNLIVATYFKGDEHEHYISLSIYLIAKANGKRKVAKLEALTVIMSFEQGNKFAPCVLILTMLVVEKEKVNSTSWFSHKLQNKHLLFSARQEKLVTH